MRLHRTANTPSSPPLPARATGRLLRLSGVLGIALWLGACALSLPPPSGPMAHLPLLSGWFEGEEVLYVTTDVSDAEVARAKHGNYAPRLAHALPRSSGTQAPQPGTPSSVDKVYGVTNHTQGSVFVSAPTPMGHANTDRAYSPLWQLIEVTWLAGQTVRTLKSEEEVLAAAEQGAVTLTTTQVVLNCPIVHRGPKGGLPGVSVDAVMH